MTERPPQLREALEHSNTRRRQRAAEIRAGGRARYVWRFGVLRAGLLLGVLGTIVAALLAPTPDLPGLGSAAPLVAWAALLVPLGMALGVPWALWMWRRFERSWFSEIGDQAPARGAT